MGKKHQKTDFDRARDELMSHVVRCEVLDAEMEHRMEWLQDTMDFMAERWPGLTDLQLAQLEMVGKQFIRPAIPHGKGNHAKNRPEPTVGGAEVKDAEATPEAESDEVPEAMEDEVPEATEDESNNQEDPELQPA